MSDIERAVDEALWQMKEFGKQPRIAIYIASCKTDIPMNVIATAMAKRRNKKHKQKRKAPVKTQIPSYERCRECGQELKPNQQECPLCGADTSWFWDISPLEIADNLDIA